MKSLWDVAKLLKQMQYVNDILRQQNIEVDENGEELFGSEAPPGLPQNEHHEKCTGPEAEKIRLQIDRTNLGEILKEVLPMVNDVLTNLILNCTVSDENDPFIREGEPDMLYQDICLQQNAIDLIIDFLKILFLPANQPGGHLGIPAWVFARNLIQKDACHNAKLAWRCLKQVFYEP